MTRVFQFSILLASLALIMFCAWWLTGRPGNPADKPKPTVESQIDPTRAANVPVVLRVKLLERGEGSKYLFPTVAVVDVLKNDTNEYFHGEFKVAHNSYGSGIPSGLSTIYLVRYNKLKPEYGWRLDESGDATKPGFTHHVADR